MEISIYQLDLSGNLISGLYAFDVDVVENGTNMSIPIADLHFEEVAPGIQLFSFSAIEVGNFWLRIFDAKHGKSIANMPYSFTVFTGACGFFYIGYGRPFCYFWAFCLAFLNKTYAIY